MKNSKFRAWLIRKLGADVLIRQAFTEGWSMREDIDPDSPNGCCWRSEGEAWANSDTEENLLKPPTIR